MSRNVFCLSLLISIFFTNNGNSALTDNSQPDRYNSTDASVNLIHGDDRIVDLEFRLDRLDMNEIYIDGERFDILSIAGEPETYPEGFPSLPSVVRMVCIPPRSGVSVNITALDSEILSGINPLPRQPQAQVDYIETVNNYSNGSSEDHIPLDAQFQDMDGFWPNDVVELGKPAILRGYRIVPVVIHPARWNPRTGELQVVKDLKFELDFSSQENKVNLVENPERVRSSRYAYQLVSQLVINPPPPPRDIEQQSGSIVYVTGDWDAIVAELEPLVEWRRRMGWTAEIMIADQPLNGNAVRNQIIEAYEEWDIPPEYVIIVGDALPQDGQFIIACHVHANVGNPYETDHPYACLEGDDILPDVAVGRFILDGPNMLRTIVNKTIQYESDPYIGEEEEVGWQCRAAVASTDWRNGSSANNMCQWSRELFLSHGFTEVPSLLCSPNNIQPNPSQFIHQNFAELGISFFVYRGWANMNGFNHDQVNQIRNDRMLPVVILATCNTGDFMEHAFNFWSYTERFLYSNSGGAIGGIGTGGATHTYYNNIFVSGALRGYFTEDIHSQGWMMMRGKVALYETYFDRGDINHDRTGVENWITHTYIYNLMGDPAVDLFSATPQPLMIEDHPEVLRVGETHLALDVVITDDDEDVPAANIPVCLYKPEVFQLVEWTNDTGHVEFTMNPEWIDEGVVQLTATGHNLIPFMADMEIEQAELFLGAGNFEMDDDEEGESQGDGDGVANPTERIELMVNITNYGEQTPEGEGTATLTPALPHLEVLDREVGFDEAPEPDQSIAFEFVVEIGGGFSHGQNALFNLEVTIGETAWGNSLSMPVEGADFEFVSLEWEGDPLEPAQLADLTITLQNTGSKSSEALTATLMSFTGTIDVPAPDGEFEAIEPGENGASRETFTLSAHPLHFGGMGADLALALQSENGFQDTVYFSFAVSEARDGQPFGPDNYGYVCFDNSDTTWFAAPIYEWIEIDPEHDGPGTNTELQDTGADRDQSVVIDLPFMFSYYGEEFRELTICTNGWIAFGDHPEIITACNRRIPGGLVTSAMVCPFWDDLVTTNDGGVFTWYDEEEDIFVVEWSRMRRLAPGQPPTETFEVILFDPEFHPSFTGDSDIIFQYLEIEDHRGAANVFGETPFATVGIGSPDFSDGLEYSYWNELHPGAAPLDSGRAIKFSTMTDFNTAFIFGNVIDAANDNPLEGVLVQTDYGFWAETDADGNYFIEDILVDTALGYTFKASKQFYNDSTLFDIEIEPDDTLEINFGLLHPEFGLDYEGLDVAIERENANDIYQPLVNTGNGPLQFTSRIEFRDIEPDRDALWDMFMEVNVTNTVVGVDSLDTLLLGNTWITGVTFVDSLFYVTAGGNINEDLPAKWYRFSRNGEFVDSLDQPWIDRRGLRGAVYDGRQFIWGGNLNHIQKFNKEDVALVDSIEVPRIRYPTDVAYDRRNDIIYICGVTSDIYAYDLEGNEVGSWNPRWENEALRKYGLAWYPDQPDSLKLLIMDRDRDMEISRLFGFNPVTGDLQFLVNIQEDPSDSPLGMDVSGRWNSSVWTLITSVSSSNGDRFSVYELEPNTTWLEYTPVEGFLQSGEETMLHIRVEAGLRPFDRYWVILHYEHDAFPGVYEIPIMMEIVPESGIDDDDSEIPRVFHLEQNYPNPFNPATTIRYMLSEDSDTYLNIYDTIGRHVSVLFEGRQTAGLHEVTFDAGNLPNGVYIYRLEAGDKIASMKMVVLK